ncbi:MAG: sigma-70 family RNA polymerase sigma factor [Oscillospiraceae bacterium]|nr:sigma-70 family RNA polymerase sigma factor [Oscillospiraceae bacterium]
MQESDRLIKRAQSGDTDAYEQLVLPLEQKVYSLCYRITNNREDAFDCAQEVMLRAYRSLGEYRFQASFSTWLYRIATNVCVDMIRKRRVRPFVSLESMIEKGVPLSDRSSNPHVALESHDLSRTLHECIAELPIDMRTAVILRDVQGLSYDEISQILRLNLGTVKSRISRARERLRKLLYKAEGFDEGFGKDFDEGFYKAPDGGVDSTELIKKQSVQYRERRKPHRDM